MEKRCFLIFDNIENYLFLLNFKYNFSDKNSMAKLLLTPNEVNALEAQADLGFQLFESVLEEGGTQLAAVFRNRYHKRGHTHRVAELLGLHMQSQGIAQAYKTLDLMFSDVPRLHNARLELLKKATPPTDVVPVHWTERTELDALVANAREAKGESKESDHDSLARATASPEGLHLYVFQVALGRQVAYLPGTIEYGLDASQRLNVHRGRQPVSSEQLIAAMQKPNQTMFDVKSMAETIRIAHGYTTLLEGLRFVRGHFPKPEGTYKLHSP